MTPIGNPCLLSLPKSLLTELHPSAKIRNIHTDLRIKLTDTDLRIELTVLCKVSMYSNRCSGKWEIKRMKTKDLEQSENHRK